MGIGMGAIYSVSDIILFELASVERRLRETTADLSFKEYEWEPIPEGERYADLTLPPERKRVWRVFYSQGAWTYDYTTEALQPPPFTTIAWIMNHIAQTADMYLHCIQTGQPEGSSKRWEDLPVQANLPGMSAYLFTVLSKVKDFSASLAMRQPDDELNTLTPAPWGELRPMYVNLWSGIIEHALQHDMQISARKEFIRYGY
jgi:hypothetical protein